MALARRLVELEETLRRQGIDLFEPIERSGLLSRPELSEFITDFDAAPQSSADFLRLSLQALSIQYDELRPRLIDAELVATLPSDVPGLARPTDRVIQEMLASARREVILLGYELTDTSLVALLADVVARNVDAIMICDRGRGAARRLLDAWPEKLDRPRVFHNRERGDDAPFSSMHAKCLLVDGSDLLITSANFTFHGLKGNIEIGVRLAGSPANEARKVFSHLVERGVVEPLE